MKRVLGIACGTINGNNEAMLKEAMKGIQDNCEAECVIVRMQDMYIKPCIGCQACIYAKLSGNSDFRCSVPAKKEHMYQFEQEIRKADAIIFSAPIYNMMPPGQLITILNKLHATGDYRNFVAANPKVGAFMGTGGSDWVNYMSPIMRMITQEYVGGYHRVVDSVIEGCVASVFLDDKLMKRAYDLGKNVANALVTGDTSWRGENGVCPVCHDHLLEVRKDGFYCPTCDIKLDMADKAGTPSFSATEKVISHNRFGEWGMKQHFKLLGMGGMKQKLGKKKIIQGHEKYDGDDMIIKFPPIE